MPALPTEPLPHRYPPAFNPYAPGPHQFPPLMEPLTAANHESYLPPSPASGPGEAGGAIPGSSVPGGGSSISPANGPAGSDSQAPSMNQMHQIHHLILSLVLYLQM